MNLTLTASEFRAEHAARPGLIPVQIDPLQRTALWMDLNGYHCYEGSFRRSLAAYTAMRAGARRPSDPWQCLSSLDFLSSTANTADCIAPTGFIFHAGRCGSTLLAKVMARSLEHLVFGEGGPHNQIWRLNSLDTDVLLRNLILHTGRRRLRSYRAHIVKFTSFNIVRLGCIRSAFPETPALFLFRHPAQILASYRRMAPGWMGADIGSGTIWHSAEAAVADFFRGALRAGNDLACLDYADLTADRLPAILRFFHLAPSRTDVELMRGEFSWDAKANHAWAPHPAAIPETEPAVSRELLVLYEELRARRTVDFQPGECTAQTGQVRY
jgi:hypothetical protein